MSLDQIKKFLESATEYPDNTPITIGDQQIPLGSLRQLNASERSSLETRLKSVAEKETELETRQGRIVDLAQKAQAAYEAAEEARRKAGTPATVAGADPFEDPWLSPVKKELEKRDLSAKEQKDMLAQVVNMVRNAATIFSEDRWDREYDSLDFGKRDKKPTRDEILKFATDNNIVDRHKMPSIRAAWSKMSESDRIADREAIAREKGREEGRMQAIAARIPQPGVAGPGQSTGLPKVSNNDDPLGDLYTKSLEDPELRALLEQTSNGIM